MTLKMIENKNLFLSFILLPLLVLMSMRNSLLFNLTNINLCSFNYIVIVVLK